MRGIGQCTSEPESWGPMGTQPAKKKTEIFHKLYKIYLRFLIMLINLGNFWNLISKIFGILIENLNVCEKNLWNSEKIFD